VDLLKNSTTFAGLPDIPLTSLSVSLNGGPHGLFVATCVPASGTANATLTDQNGDKTVTAASAFTISGCPATGGSGASGGGGTSPMVTAPNISGLGSGHPTLSFTVRVGKRAPKLRAITIVLPTGLSFVSRGAGALRGISLTGAKIKTLSVSHQKLVITLRKPVSRLRVEINSSLLQESPALQTKAKHLRTLTLTVIAENTRGHRTTIHVHVKNPGL
jgi:hypothetical protein